jgi:hypothetical protein
MIRVGCKLTNVARNEANSEYLRFTSRPYASISTSSRRLTGWTYAAIDRVLYKVDIILPSLGDQDELPRVFVQPLLDARIVASFLWRDRFAALLVLVVVDIAHIPLRDIFRRLLSGGGCLGRRRRGSVWHYITVSSESQANRHVRL